LVIYLLQTFPTARRRSVGAATTARAVLANFPQY